MEQTERTTSLERHLGERQEASRTAYAGVVICELSDLAARAPRKIMPADPAAYAAELQRIHQTAGNVVVQGFVNRTASIDMTCDRAA